MTIGEDIVGWAATRPAWQQRVLQILAQGRSLTEGDLAAVVDSLLDASGVDQDQQPLDLALPPPDDATVSLLRLAECVGVNSLADHEELDCAPTGLTLIYGDNGSGKSGYARIVKELAGARHSAEVLPDVFEERPAEPAAKLWYSVDGEEHEQKFPGASDAVVKKLSFYDEHCGDVYITTKSVVTYRPSALALLDGLIDVCDRVRAALSTQLVENQRTQLDLGIPAETTAGAFLAGLTAATSLDAITAATTPDPNATQARADASAAVAHLESTNAVRERQRIEQLAQAADDVATHLAALVSQLSAVTLGTAEEELSKATVARQAAETAAQADFSQELPGVGGEAWRTLWLAARDYATQVAYPGEAFPATHDGARCVLCQQVLSSDANDRFARFDAHMKDTTQRDAAAAEATVARRTTNLQGLNVSTSKVSGDLALVAERRAGLADEVSILLESAEQTKRDVVAWLAGETPAKATGLKTDSQVEALRTTASSLRAEASGVDVDAFQTALLDALSQRREVEAAALLCDSREQVIAEIARLRQRQLLQRAMDEVSTNSITFKSTQLTKLYAGDVLKNEFIRETERLGLQRVTITDLGGHKGQLEQQPTLLGAKASGIKTRSVLSEGEQTAMGLAGFFTEATFDQSKSALILDDPVTSLDHVRRSRVAQRLVEFSADRQVIVFTHDVAFAGVLQKAAEKHDLPVTTRSIERQGQEPGHVRKALPWKAKDFAARLASIEQQLADLRKNRTSYGQDEWDKAVGGWAGDLSELWESCVSSEILDEVFDRGKSEVRVMKFRILVAISRYDDLEFQAGYDACSTWARRHNKSAETNYVPPEPNEMQAEVDRIRKWQAQMKKYRS